MRVLASLMLLLVLPLAVCAEGWNTFRGNPQRTGCTDGKAGPLTPKVLWAMKSKEHYVAAPVPHGDRLFVSGLGFVNNAVFSALDLKAKDDKRLAWKKEAPLLELPTVSSPAIADGKLIFGDGMHQTDGASVYGLDLEKGGLLWQLKVEGTLVHLEGSPTVAGGKVYIGGGAAGVLCIDPGKLTMGGKEIAPAAVAKAIEARRVQLQKEFEDRLAKKDPFAVPPKDQDLPRAQPHLAWQVGKVKWHVDAAVTVVGERVLAASAYLDKEKVGLRAILCLDAWSGKELWQQPLAINPWGGPSVEGKVVVVSGSTIPYDPAALAGAKGVVAAFDLEDGKPRWRKELPGGVLSCVALSKDLAVATCTDGKVRAYGLEKGAIRWTYTGGTAFFAPPALSGDTAYVADLKGTVHAINLKVGTARWKLDLGTDPAVQAPGMVYGGPVLHGGNLYVATCNIAGEHVNKATAVVCIGEK